MLESPPTRASLLVRIRDGQDQDAWREFVQIYAPAVYNFGRKRGLQDADAADLMQDVLRSVAGAVGRLNYDPRRGNFRGWLYTIARNKLYNFLDGRRRRAPVAGDATQQLEAQADPDAGDPVADWDREYERRLSAYAMERVRPEFQETTWQAFWLTAVDGLDARAVGDRLGLSPGAVYVAKSRVLARLKKEVQALQGE